MVFSSIFNLMGLINVLLIWWTRPAILLIDSDGCLSPADPRTAEKDEGIRMTTIIPPPRNMELNARQNKRASARRPRPAGNNFGGVGVGIPRDEV